MLQVHTWTCGIFLAYALRSSVSFYTCFMTTYVALLRGIGPMNPNMRPAKLKGAFENMGFKDVRTVISSGNVIFSSPSKNAAALEKKIEAALPKLLRFSSTTIVRSQKEIETLLKKNAGKGITHDAKNYLLVTFLQKHSGTLRTFPKKGPGFRVLGVYKRELCMVVDTKNVRTPNVMVTMEKAFGKQITSRTWKTVERIATRMDEG